MKDNIYGIILAAGEGKRMMSKHPKPLQIAGGKPIIDRICDALSGAGAKETVVVVGHKAEEIKEHLGNSVIYATQVKRQGTGQALMLGAEPLKDESGTVIVLCGDTPLITKETLLNAIESHESAGFAATVITAFCDNPYGYGRIVRDSKDCDTIEKIMEEKDASEDEKKIKEINAGMYLFDIQKLLPALNGLTTNNAQGEYYLTDALINLRDSGERVGAYVTDFDEVIGVNDRCQLSVADKLLNMRNVKRLMESGARVISPETVIAGDDVVVGRDTVIYPNTILEGKTIIGEDCVIGPDTGLKNTVVGSNTEVNRSVLTDSVVGDNVNVGPFAYLRPNSNIGNNVKVGDFVEVKNSAIGDGTKIAHLTYIGDAKVGSRVNFGCGTVVVNYDGINKNQTVIGDDCFIGCNTNLVSPVKIGDGAYTAAGSTITEEVPEDALAIARARQVIKEGRAKGKTKNNR